MTRRRDDMLKPTHELEILNVHGPTVTASDGAQGRRYRKVTTQAFRHAMFESAWTSSVDKAGVLASRLVKGTERPGRVKKELELVTFAVVSEVCFGIRTTPDGDMILERHVPHVGKMNYWESFAVSAEHMGVTFLTPKALMSRSPFAVHARARESNTEWLAYMEDMIQEKRMERKDGHTTKASNLLGTILLNDFLRH
jgi:cytochrome P450